MKQDTIIKRDKDRKTELNRVVVNIPSNLKELVDWKSPTKQQKWKNTSTVAFWGLGKRNECECPIQIGQQEKGHGRRNKEDRGLDQECSCKHSGHVRKMLNGESLTKEELALMTKKTLQGSGFGNEKENIDLHWGVNQLIR